MTEREALKLALDAFGEIAWSNETQWQRDRAKEAITAIKEALAQPEQEPVAQYLGTNGGIPNVKMLKPVNFGADLYTTPPQQELVCVWCAVWAGQELVETPPQRKPLTDEEITQVFGVGYVAKEFVEFVRAIEAAHGIKE